MFTKGGHKAVAGTYWNMVNGSRIELAEEGVLPGGRETTYVRASSIVMLAAGPILGLVFAMFLPLIGIVMAVGQLVRMAGEGLKEAAAASITFGWKPIEAYLTGRKRKKAEQDKNKEKKS